MVRAGPIGKRSAVVVDEPLQSCLANQELLPGERHQLIEHLRSLSFLNRRDMPNLQFPLAEHTSPAPRATASQRSTMSLRRVSMMAITSLCSAAGTLYLSRDSERWPTTMSNSALVIPSPACVVFAERLITLHGPPVTLHTRFLVFCLNVSRVSVPIPTKYLPTVGSTNSRSSKSSTTAEMPL